MSTSSYLTISILLFIGKFLTIVVYRVVSASSTLILSSLLNPLKTGLCLHATDSTLIKVTRDLHLAKGKGKLLFFILLNLSASFASIDHSILSETCLGFYEHTISCFFFLLCLSHLFFQTHMLVLSHLTNHQPLECSMAQFLNVISCQFTDWELPNGNLQRRLSPELQITHSIFP